eukprot:2885370-Pyramimonas_sp.AAC.1
MAPVGSLQQKKSAPPSQAAKEGSAREGDGCVSISKLLPERQRFEVPGGLLAEFFFLDLGLDLVDYGRVLLAGCLGDFDHEAKLGTRLRSADEVGPARARGGHHTDLQNRLLPPRRGLIRTLGGLRHRRGWRAPCFLHNGFGWRAF